jgi:NDP-sugar pyrophosphorylase family protein
VDVGGRPLLARQLSYLAREGVTRVVVNAHHLSESSGSEQGAAHRTPSRGGGMRSRPPKRRATPVASR